MYLQGFWCVLITCPNLDLFSSVAKKLQSLSSKENKKKSFRVALMRALPLPQMSDV